MKAEVKHVVVMVKVRNVNEGPHKHSKYIKM